MSKLKIEGHSLSPAFDAETFNELYEKGYRFYCDGDYKTLSTTDPWSGMPNIDYNTYFFTDENEARAFAAKQKWPFNPKMTATVHELPPHTKTDDERRAEQDAKDAAAKQRKHDNMLKRARAAGVSDENADDWERVRLQVNKITREISNNEYSIQQLTSQITELQKTLADLKTQLSGYEGSATESFADADSLDALGNEPSTGLVDKAEL